MTDTRYNTLFSRMSAEANESLQLIRAFVDHPCMKGSASETFWIEFLRKYLPDKYGINSGKVIDSSGTTSDQIDIIIYNKETFPYIFRGRNTYYIPIESVFCVLEVKQTIKNNIPYIAQKIESVRKLAPLFKSENKEFEGSTKLPYLILGGLLSTDSSISETCIKEQLLKLKGIQTIDIGCCLSKYGFYVKYSCPDGREFSYTARNTNASIFFYNKDIALMAFVFQLIQRLQQNARNAQELLINIDAYLKNVHAEIDPDPIATALF